MKTLKELFAQKLFRELFVCILLITLFSTLTGLFGEGGLFSNVVAMYTSLGLLFLTIASTIWIVIKDNNR